MLADIAAAPEAIRAALEVITETTARYAAEALAAGADGIFLATQAANAQAVTEAISTTWFWNVRILMARQLISSTTPVCRLAPTVITSPT